MQYARTYILLHVCYKEHVQVGVHVHVHIIFLYKVDVKSLASNSQRNQCIFYAGLLMVTLFARMRYETRAHYALLYDVCTLFVRAADAEVLDDGAVGDDGGHGRQGGRER